jgi:hypothetical protein
MISVQRFFTADDTDVLANTDLANIPGPGQLDLFIASTQNDTVFTFTGPGAEPIARLIRVEQRTNGQPSLIDSSPFSVAVDTGHYTLNVDIVTAATVGVIAHYRSLGELLGESA